MNECLVGHFQWHSATQPQPVNDIHQRVLDEVSKHANDELASIRITVEKRTVETKHGG